MTKYQFPQGPNSNLKLGYTRLVLDEKSQAEVDEQDKEMMALVEYFGGVVAPPEKPKKEDKPKAEPPKAKSKDKDDK